MQDEQNNLLKILLSDSAGEEERKMARWKHNTIQGVLDYPEQYQLEAENLARMEAEEKKKWW